MTAVELKEYLDVMKGAGLMYASLHLPDGFQFVGTFGPDSMPQEGAAPPAAPGGWKMDPQDALDPDPLKLGDLDAPFAMDPVSEAEPE